MSSQYQPEGGYYLPIDSTGSINGSADTEGESRKSCWMKQMSCLGITTVRWRFILAALLLTATVSFLIGHFVVMPQVIGSVVGQAKVTITAVNITNPQPTSFDLAALGSIEMPPTFAGLSVAAELDAFQMDIMYKGMIMETHLETHASTLQS